jgi:hypothetical protein
LFTSLDPFELIDHNGDGNITRDEWQEKIELAMEQVTYITNATYRVFQLDLSQNKRLLGHQKCIFKS